jgi:hypothetical protein
VRFTTATCAIMLSQNHFREPNCSYFDVSFIQILVCRITYDHPWRCSYKIVNQACYNMVPNLFVSCVIHPQLNHNEVGFQRTVHLWVCGVTQSNIYKLTVDMEFSPTDSVVASILPGFISFHKHLHCAKWVPFGISRILSSSFSSC